MNKYQVYLPNTQLLWIEWATKADISELFKNEGGQLSPMRFIVEHESGKREKMTRNGFIYFLNH